MDSLPQKSPHLKFRFIDESFAICRLAATDSIPEWAGKGIFTSITRTPDELSIVCPVENVPTKDKPETPWACLKLEGPFAFSEVGILEAFIRPLAENGVPIFAIATYDTDYVLVQSAFVGIALDTLREAGYELIG